MQNVSMLRALDIWTYLEQAYHGTSSYGGHTAEIYMYLFMPYSPSASQVFVRGWEEFEKEGSSYCLDAAKAAYVQAYQSLYAFLTHFAKSREAKIDVEGRELGEWIIKDGSEARAHRVHVTVTPGRDHFCHDCTRE